MIHLDTSFLIRGFVAGTLEHARVRRWLGDRESIGLSSIAWGEFLCGPVPPQVVEEIAEALGEPRPFDGGDATLAAELFNLGGRRRGHFADCMIAACAIRADATLATSNAADFRGFEKHGLVIESP